MLDFNLFNKNIEKCSKKNDVLRCGENYIYHILYHQITVSDIDFSLFSYKDINRVIENFGDDFDYIEDSDEFNILPSSPLYAMSTTCNVIKLLNASEVMKIKRKRQFL
ncbi:hypothetical protein ACQKNX_22600 [Lysinibacillus sp. NPDC093712]|uniref:hypothetical protein n=1 Tax=Lysinibacillus sp. NPDC093712 TaxID=3390579 RepID=UPI003CFC0B1B